MTIRLPLLLVVAVAVAASCARAPSPSPPPQPGAAPASGPTPLLPGDFAYFASRYETIRVALVAGTLPDAAINARFLGIGAKSGGNMLARDSRRLSPSDAAVAIAIHADIAAAAAKLAKAPDLDAARAAFAEVTTPMIAWRQRTAGDLPAVACCARTGACWLQPAGAPHGNPYDPAATDCNP